MAQGDGGDTALPGAASTREAVGEKVAVVREEVAATEEDILAWLDSTGSTGELTPVGPSGSGCVFGLGEGHILKLCTSHRAWTQERSALRNLAPALGGMAPELVADSDALRALLMTRLKGEPATSLSADDRTAWLTVLRSIGRLVSALHATPLQDGDPMPMPEALGRRAAAWLERAARLRLPEHAAAATILRTIPGTFDHEGRVWCHRDNQARNWLVEGSTFRGLVDFEHARPDHWLADLVKLPDEAGALPECDVLAAFLEGYGRAEAIAEPGFMESWRWLRALHGLATLVRAAEDGDGVMMARGRAILAS